jgi:hypothetical protein
MKYSGEITSLKDLSEITEAVNTSSIKLQGAFQCYRGHGCCSYKLMSYISRYFSDNKLLQTTEFNIIDDLKKGIESLNLEKYFYIPQNANDFHENWYWLSQAQHLGIPTRLLDWTLCSEIALYFAVTDDTCTEQDGDFWVFFVPDELNIYSQDGIISNINPFEVDKDLFISIPVSWNKNYEIQA